MGGEETATTRKARSSPVDNETRRTISNDDDADDLELRVEGQRNLLARR